jgi:FMN phosphatase YigB (HAD superfamily)
MMFDWGDTVMKDDPTLDTPMYQWPTVETIDGAEEVLRTLHAQRTIIMATGAAQSDEVDIRLALQRVNLDNYFDHIFCFKNTGLRKLGDNFASDIQGANYVGISGVWLNQKDTQEKRGEHFSTIHRLLDLLLFFKVV